MYEEREGAYQAMFRNPPPPPLQMTMCVASQHRSWKVIMQFQNTGPYNFVTPQHKVNISMDITAKDFGKPHNYFRVL